MRKERGSFLGFLQICFSEGYSEGKAKQISDHVSVSEGYKALWRGKTRSRCRNLLEGLKQLFRYGLRKKKKKHVCGWGPALWLERRAPTTHQPGMEDMEPPLQPITFSLEPLELSCPITSHRAISQVSEIRSVIQTRPASNGANSSSLFSFKKGIHARPTLGIAGSSCRNDLHVSFCNCSIFRDKY